eukprot:m.800798 g.800798  ORF g.800798 m.800798 type:complete len:94 (-) comp23357_c0_seq27:1807-2088(-)
MVSNADELNVVLLRHGESTNNVLLRKITENISDSGQKEHEWMSQRTDDPALTPLGRAQAAQAAKVLVCVIWHVERGTCLSRDVPRAFWTIPVD